MDEADQILIQDLHSLGVEVQSLQELNSNKFVYAIAVVLKSISEVLRKHEGATRDDSSMFTGGQQTVQGDFMDREKLELAMRFDEASNKFQVCQVLLNYLKKLGFYYDLNFNDIFYPNITNIRKVLGYLFEYISKKEQEAQLATGGDAAGEFGDYRDEKDSFQFMLKRRLEKWVKKPWIMPEFYLETKTTFARNRRRIRVFDQRDKDNIANTKNKKILGIHEFLEQVKPFTERVDFKNETLTCAKISDSAFWKAYEYENKQDGGILDDEESPAEVQRREYQQERANAFDNLRGMIPRKIRNINQIINEKKASYQIDVSSAKLNAEPEYNLFSRNVKFEQQVTPTIHFLAIFCLIKSSQNLSILSFPRLP
jgi:hypothetical protein